MNDSYGSANFNRREEGSSGLFLNTQDMLHAYDLRDDKNLSISSIHRIPPLALEERDSIQILLESFLRTEEDQSQPKMRYQQNFPFKTLVISQKVKDLKELVSEKIYPSAKEFVLMYRGKLLLEEEKALIEYGIVDQSKVIVIPASYGGDCLKFTQLVLETMIKDLPYLKSSLNFLNKQDKLERLVALIRGMIRNIKRIKPELANAPEEGLIAVMLWTSNILYKQLNQDLGGGNNSSQWNVYLKNFLNGLKAMPYYRGTVYCGFNSQKDLEVYKNNRLVTWKTICGLSTNKDIASTFTGPNGILFEVEVFSSRNISSISLISFEEQVIILPYSCFEVIAVIEEPEQPIYIKLREVPTPRVPKVVLWIDDNPERNNDIAQKIEQNDISCIFCVSTKDAFRVIERYQWFLSLENTDFKIITNMVRREDGVLNFSAGVDFIEKLVEDYQYNFEVLIFCGDLKRAQEKCNARQLNSNFSITNNPTNIFEFLNIEKKKANFWNLFNFLWN